jgi:hypothetical protein
MRWVAQMTAHHVDELGVPFRGPDGRGMADCPNDKSRNLEPQAKPNGRGQRRCGQRPTNWRVEASYGFMGRDPAHQTSAPPPKEKNVRNVRRQSFWDRKGLKIRESLARLVCDVMRPADGAASGDWRLSVV